MPLRTPPQARLDTWNLDTTPVGGIPIGTVFTSGKVNLAGYTKLRGGVFCDVAGVLVLNFRAQGGGAVVWTKTIPLDGSQPNFTYTLTDELIRAPYTELIFTVGGAPGTTFRAFTEALPI